MSSRNKKGKKKGGKNNAPKGAESKVEEEEVEINVEEATTEEQVAETAAKSSEEVTETPIPGTTTSCCESKEVEASEEVGSNAIEEAPCPCETAAPSSNVDGSVSQDSEAIPAATEEPQEAQCCGSNDQAPEPCCPAQEHSNDSVVVTSCAAEEPQETQCCCSNDQAPEPRCPPEERLNDSVVETSAACAEPVDEPVIEPAAEPIAEPASGIPAEPAAELAALESTHTEVPAVESPALPVEEEPAASGTAAGAALSAEALATLGVSEAEIEVTEAWEKKKERADEEHRQDEIVAQNEISDVLKSLGVPAGGEELAHLTSEAETWEKKAVQEKTEEKIAEAEKDSTSLPTPVEPVTEQPQKRGWFSWIFGRRRSSTSAAAASAAAAAAATSQETGVASSAASDVPAPAQAPGDATADQAENAAAETQPVAANDAETAGGEASS